MLLNFFRRIPLWLPTQATVLFVPVTFLPNNYSKDGLVISCLRTYLDTFWDYTRAGGPASVPPKEEATMITHRTKKKKKVTNRIKNLQAQRNGKQTNTRRMRWVATANITSLTGMAFASTSRRPTLFDLLSELTLSAREELGQGGERQGEERAGGEGRGGKMLHVDRERFILNVVFLNIFFLRRTLLAFRTAHGHADSPRLFSSLRLLTQQ